MKKTYQVPDMECSMCAMHLEVLEDELPGIRFIKASYHQQSLTVDFDEKTIDEGTLLRAVKEKGYTLIEKA
jgi:copper chaperone CopZ